MTIDPVGPTGSVVGIDAPRTTDVRRRTGRAIGVVLLLVGIAAVGWAVVRGSDGGATASGPTTTSHPTTTLAAGTTSPTTVEGLGVGFGPEVDGRTPLRGFGQVAATITAGDGSTCEVCLLAAESEAQRERGLMEVTDPDLGGYDGMVFVYAQPTGGAFWMRNTPMPLSIAYFDGSGRLVSTADMTPCDDVPSCPSYPAAGAFAYALEVPKGRLADVGVVGEPGEVAIELTGRDCPLAAAS